MLFYTFIVIANLPCELQGCQRFQLFPNYLPLQAQILFLLKPDNNCKMQGQRELERRVRKSKRECMTLEKLGDTEGLTKASATLKQRQQALKQYCSDNSLSYKPDRTAVVGYNRAVAGKVRKSLTSASKGGTINKRPYEIIKSHKKWLEIIRRGISEERPIFAIDTDTNKFASYVRNVPPKKGFYDVALHGAHIILCIVCWNALFQTMT